MVTYNGFRMSHVFYSFEESAVSLDDSGHRTKASYYLTYHNPQPYERDFLITSTWKARRTETGVPLLAQGHTPTE